MMATPYQDQAPAADGEIFMLAEEIARLRGTVDLLRKALDWLLHETMYKDHPEASQNAIDVLARTQPGPGAGDG